MYLIVTYEENVQKNTGPAVEVAIPRMPPCEDEPEPVGREVVGFDAGAERDVMKCIAGDGDLVGTRKGKWLVVGSGGGRCVLR